jgi:hypothetical protein
MVSLDIWLHAANRGSNQRFERPNDDEREKGDQDPLRPLPLEKAV